MKNLIKSITSYFSKAPVNPWVQVFTTGNIPVVVQHLQSKDPSKLFNAIDENFDQIQPLLKSFALTWKREYSQQVQFQKEFVTYCNEGKYSFGEYVFPNQYSDKITDGSKNIHDRVCFVVALIATSNGPIGLSSDEYGQFIQDTLSGKKSGMEVDIMLSSQKSLSKYYKDFCKLISDVVSSEDLSVDNILFVLRSEPVYGIIDATIHTIDPNNRFKRLLTSIQTNRQQSAVSTEEYKTELIAIQLRKLSFEELIMFAAKYCKL